MFKYILAGLLLPSSLVQCLLDSGNGSSWDSLTWSASDRLASALAVSGYCVICVALAPTFLRLQGSSDG